MKTKTTKNKNKQTKKATPFQGNHFVCVGEGRMVCGGGSVGVLRRYVWRSLGAGVGCGHGLVSE